MNTFNDETIRSLQSMYHQQQYYGMAGQNNYYALWREAETKLTKATDELYMCRKERDNYKNKLIKIKTALATRQKAREEIIGELEGI